MPKGKLSEAQIQEQIAVGAILTAALAVIEATLGPLETMTPTAWKQRNKNVAREMHKAGRTPEDVAKMLKIAFADKFYPKSVMLNRLQELWTSVRDRARTKAIEQKKHVTGAGKEYSPDDLRNLR